LLIPNAWYFHKCFQNHCRQLYTYIRTYTVKKLREISMWTTVARTKRREGLRHRCQHRNLAHSDMSFLQCMYIRTEYSARSSTSTRSTKCYWKIFQCRRPCFDSVLQYTFISASPSTLGCLFFFSELPSLKQ
jgi:hypothetical protein